MKIILILVFALSFFSFAMGQAKNEGSKREADDVLVLQDLSNRWLQADAKGDAPTVNLFLAYEFSFLAGNSRAQYLASMNPDPALTVESAVVEDQKVQIYGETAIVTGINSYRLKREGRPIQARFPSMTIWVKKSGRWQCVKACTLPALTS